jgi:dienelactone hydrolase
VTLDAAGVTLPGDLCVPQRARGIVLFAHGSGSSRTSPRNRQVAAGLQRAGFATLLMDLLTADEEERDQRTGELRFDIGLLAQRLVVAVDRLTDGSLCRSTATLPVGTFGASTGAAAALIAATRRPDQVHAVVSRGGRPDLAADTLCDVHVPVLLVVGSADRHVLELNEHAATHLAHAQVRQVPGATHLFPEPGALDQVTELATDWFTRHLGHERD